MRVFVTGASGHIGSAVVPELLAAGHEVVGLARSDASAAVARRRGRRGAAAATSTTSTASGRPPPRRRRHPPGLQARGDALGRLSRARPPPTWRPSRPWRRRWRARASPSSAPRARCCSRWPASRTRRAPSGRRSTGRPARRRREHRDRDWPRAGVRSSVVRLPPTVHSSLDHHGFVPTLIGIARANGVAGYVGDGVEPVARRAHARRGAAVPAGAGGGAGGRAAARGRRRGRAVPRHRRGHRAAPRPAGRRAIAAEDAGAHFGFLAPLRRARQPRPRAS